jgi:hypothetical protein
MQEEFFGINRREEGAACQGPGAHCAWRASRGRCRAFLSLRYRRCPIEHLAQASRLNNTSVYCLFGSREALVFDCPRWLRAWGAAMG